MDGSGRRLGLDEGHTRIFGVDPPTHSASQAALKVSVRKFFADEDWDSLMRVLLSATPEHTAFQAETRIRRPSAEVRYCLIAGSAKFDAEGRLPASTA